MIALFLLLLWVDCIVAQSELDLFENWAAKYHVAVHSNYDALFENWRFHHRYIQWANSKNRSFTLAHNQFSAMDIREKEVFPFKVKASKVCSWQWNETTTIRPMDRGVIHIEPCSDKALLHVLDSNRVAFVRMSISTIDLLFYSAGILTTAYCGTDIEVDAIVTGYGYDDVWRQDYYSVALGWGRDWGENGAVRLPRGKQYNGGAGQCGILLEPVYYI